MNNKIKQKLFSAMGVSDKYAEKENLSFRMLFVFFTSKKGIKKTYALVLKTIQYILRKTLGIKFNPNNYKKWIRNNKISKKETKINRLNEKKLLYRPKISIILKLIGDEKIFDTIFSVQNQVYSNWELCIYSNNSVNNLLNLKIQEYIKDDNRIKQIIIDSNQDFSISFNEIQKNISGDFIAQLFHNDLLTPHTLYKTVLELNRNKEIDFIYTDEDSIDLKGKRQSPYFKPDWSQNTLLHKNYLGNFVLISKKIINNIDDFYIGLEGVYDLYLKASEKAKNIYHIPDILYHKRTNVSPLNLMDNNKKAIEDALYRRGLTGEVAPYNELYGIYQIHYNIKTIKKVSVIIPTKNLVEITNTCLKSIFELTNYPDFEVILINNNSDELAFFDMVEKWTTSEPLRFKYITDNGDFNFSRLMNNGVKNSKGDYILLLNNDTEVIDENWMSSMVEYAQHKNLGAIGVKLLYHNDTIQHAGVIIGIGGVADHIFTGVEKDDVGYFGCLSTTTNYSALTAACLMVSKEKFNLVNGFDENLAIEFNDVDFCLKLADKGYENIYLPHVVLYHYESISRGHPSKTKASYERHLKEIALFKAKWKKYIDHDPCYNPNLSKYFSDFRINV
ncbi:MAG: glycosyltransferase family 2 protein [Vicingaceae bacterium]|nr:glycosyltransferase family 2 protein [Vicingaceae bacterium]